MDMKETNEFETFFDKQPLNWRDRLIDMACIYPEIQYLLKCNGLEMFPLGDLIVIKGKAKKGKSHAILCFMIALLKGEFVGLEAIQDGITILYVDTEMNPINTFKMSRKVLKLCGFDMAINNVRFVTMNLRGDNPSDRETMIEDAIKELKPTVLFVDGAKDLMVSDINDQADASRVVNTLMRWTKEYNCALCTVLHENKKDDSMRGAIGTELLNKVAEAWQITRDSGGTFKMAQTDCRNRPVDGFSFMLDSTGEPVEVLNMPKVSAEERKAERMKFLFKQCFDDASSLKYTELRTVYEKVADCKSTAAGNAIKFAESVGLISKNQAEMYILSGIAT